MTDTAAATAAIEQKTKILRITLAVTVLSFIIFLITLTSSQWVLVTYPPNFFSTRQKMYLVRSTYGIVWECTRARLTNVSVFGMY